MSHRVLPTRRDALALLAMWTCRPGMQASSRVVEAQKVNDVRVFLEIPGTYPQLLTGTSPRDSYGSSIVDFSTAGPLRIQQVTRHRAGQILARSFEVYAQKDAAFSLALTCDCPHAESFYSWRREEPSRCALTQDSGEMDRIKADSQLFPFAGAVSGGILTGLLGDSPGFWENRSQQVVDPARRQISIRTGDGSSARLVTKIWGDTSGFYRGEVDGWQHMRAGETRTFTTWLFRAPVRDLYDVRLAAHRALAAAKGWNDSALTAILRNNAYLQVRRNLLRDESRYVFISGPNYGWKEWVRMCSWPASVWMTRRCSPKRYAACSGNG